MIPKVSIITVTYNCEDIIEKTLLSSINQDYENKEIIIIDGNSSDDTLNIINKYKSSIDVILSEEDNGIFDAMNKGLLKASGEWVAFMNAGDSFINNKILNTIRFLLCDESCDVIYAPHVLKYKSRERLIDDIPFFNNTKKYKTMGFSHQSCLVRTKLARIYKFQPGFNLSADYKMVWDLYYLAKASFKKIDKPISIMDDTGGVTTSNYKKHLKEECNICGFPDTISRKLFIEYKFIEYKVKRMIKRLCF